MAGSSPSSQEAQTVLALRSYQLADVLLTREGSEARLIFVNEAESQRELVLGGLYQFAFSRHPDEEGTFIVDLSLTETEEGGLSTLQHLGFGFTDRKGKPVSSTARRLYHVHLEGDIVLDAVCATVRVLDRGT